MATTPTPTATGAARFVVTIEASHGSHVGWSPWAERKKPSKGRREKSGRTGKLISWPDVCSPRSNSPSHTEHSTPPDPSRQALELPPRQLPVVHSYTILLVKESRFQPDSSSRASSFPGASHLTPSGHERHTFCWLLSTSL